MFETIALALVVSVVAPAIMAILTNRSNNKTKKQEAEINRAIKLEDWARQDHVAELLKEHTIAVKEAAESTNLQLVDIHDLVNSDMTKSMEVARNALSDLVNAMELAFTKGKPTEQEEVDLETAKAGLSEMETKLKDRDK